MGKILLLFMFALFLVCGKMQAQTIVYTYNSTGECISRVLEKNESKVRKQTKGNSAPDLLKVVVCPSTRISDNLSIAVNCSKKPTNLVYFLSDVSGRLFLHGSLYEGDNSISVSELPQGYYILKIEGQEYVKIYKLIKE